MKHMKAKSAPADPYLLLRIAVIGGIIGCLLSVIVLVLLAFLLSQKDIPAGMDLYLSFGAFLMGALGSGFVAAKLLREKGAIIGGAAGVAFFAFLAIVSLIFSGGAVTWMMVVKLFTGLLAGAIGGIFGVNLKKKHKI